MKQRLSVCAQFGSVVQQGSAGFTLVETVVALAVGMLVMAALGSLTAVGLTRAVQLHRRVEQITELQQLTRRIQQQAADIQPPFWESPRFFSQITEQPPVPADLVQDSRNSVYGWQISIEHDWLDTPIEMLAPFGARPLE